MWRINWSVVGIVALIVAMCVFIYFNAVGWPFTRIPHYLPPGVMR